MQIPVIWFKNKSDKDKSDIEYILKNNHTLVRALLDVIDEFETEEVLAETKMSDYDSPSWSHKQADRNGAKRALKKVRTLFKFMDAPAP